MRKGQLPRAPREVNQMTEFSGPLSGIKVLDLTTVFMGPSATQMLGDLGADVIKVEAPGGDSTRTLGPHGEHGLGPLFLGLNRNKRSIVIDLKSAGGVALLLEFAKSADVLATNVRPAAMDRLGLGYARLAEVNPRLVYASMVGFSQKGPYGPKAAYDDLTGGDRPRGGDGTTGRWGAPLHAPDDRRSFGGALR